MLSDGETLADLRARFPHSGRVAWIGVRGTPRGAVHALDRATLRAGRGIEGDHRARRGGGRRQVTLVQQEHLAVIAALLGGGEVEAARLRHDLDPVRLRHDVDPVRLRRNVVVSGINVAALKGVRFRLGGALLEGTGACHPCSRMEHTLGPGGYNAMRGHGGLTAVVLEDGELRVGDRLSVVARE